MRTWNLRINLDTFNSAYARLFEASDHSDFLNGLYRGMNRGKVPPECSDAMAMGFEIGADMRAEAEAYIERSAEMGRKSAARKSNKIEGPCQGPTQGPYRVTPDQSTIHNPQSTNNPLPPKKKRIKRETTSIPDDILPEVVRLCSVWPRQSIGDIGPGGVQRSQDLRAWSDPVDLYEHWLSAYPTVEPAILAACGTVYLEGIEYVEDEWTGKKTPKYCYAMRNFYGQKEYWKLFKGAALERLKDAIR